MTGNLRTALALAAPLLAVAPGAAAPADGRMEEAEVERIVERYIRENPALILDVLQDYATRTREREERLERTRLLDENWAELSGVPGDPSLGPEDADAVLVEFFDYRCGFCRRNLEAVMALARDDDRLRVVFKEWPILGPESTLAARASLAATRQGRWLEMHEALMAAEGPIDGERIRAMALEEGLDPVRLEADMESPETDAVLRRNHALALRIGLRGTPAFVARNAIVRQALSYEELARMVAEARADDS